MGRSEEKDCESENGLGSKWPQSSPNSNPSAMGKDIFH